MDFFSFGPIAAVLGAAYSFLTALSAMLTPLFGTAAAAASIVALTLLVRAALIPVGVSQVRAENTRRRLAPRLAELQRRHRGNPERLQRETMALYRQENASPFAGCLPLVLQAPVLSIVYALFLHPQINGSANALLAQHLGPVPLGASFIHLLGTAGGAAGGTVGPVGLIVVGAVLALIAGVAAASRRLLASAATPGLSPAPVPSPAAATPGSASAPAGLARVLSFLPFLTVVFAAFVPVAAALYLLTTTSWTLAERLVVRRVLARGGARG
ncbi:membrane protein insertase YidC [Microbacterium sp. STN6]|uniref:YidC/Oxa1 family membrane protein insertase n=1 Tax=Microbacterium sp. STN6 TaxID=2995588 RepID=UPI002260E71F|nr:membrane protein insertase YidC [Microbacterium sp. STN6]MCX7522166.1 membrane protein insertase YidC [Microbacterium sp. STN6]